MAALIKPNNRFQESAQSVHRICNFLLFFFLESLGNATVIEGIIADLQK